MELSRAEKVLNLYDYCWFELQILKIKQPFSSNSSSSESEQDHREEITQENEKKQPKPEISRVPTHHNRSMSDQSIMNTTDHSSPKLCTILSGKEIPGFENPETENLEVAEPPKKKVSNRRRRKGFESKSLSDLEFEELKGFMDLGFVFSEEDRESSLASIIPGLQRLGKNNKELEEEKEKEEEEKRDFANGFVISRPYLSEAWEVFDLRPKRENPLMNWRIPASENEIDMKDNLRWWAHTVASTVR